MFIYLSKKIAVPNNATVHSVNWNGEHGWIACGAADGLLKILKLDSSSPGGKVDPEVQQKIKKSSNLLVNQTLEGHRGAVICSAWNEPFQRLTTSDENGLIIVWQLYKGQWFEDMVNDRDKSTVRDMCWTADGQRVCIVYADGAVIVGSVDGHREWGKDLQFELRFVQWSPDGRAILFVSGGTEAFIYDYLGNRVSKLHMHAVSGALATSQPTSIAGIDWYSGVNGYLEDNVPCLAICFANGRAQIMRSDVDPDPVLIDTGMHVTHCRWNTTGSVLAIAGAEENSRRSNAARSSNDYSNSDVTYLVQFYNPFGKHMRTLKVPGGVSSLSWEGGSLRLALAIDSYIYFANVRPTYEWGFMGNTLVYAFNRPGRPESIVAFWDTARDERHTKYVKQLVAIHAADEHCLIATRRDESESPAAGSNKDDKSVSKPKRQQYILIVCDAIGSPIDSRYIDVEPVYIAMTPLHVVVASNDTVYVWKYRSPGSKLASAVGAAVNVKHALQQHRQRGTATGAGSGGEHVFHVDSPDTLLGAAAVGDQADVTTRHPQLIASTNDPIVSVAASKTTFVVGRASGTIMQFALPLIFRQNTFTVKCRPQQLYINCDDTRLAIIDTNGVLTLLDVCPDNPVSTSSTTAALPTGDSGDGATAGRLLDFRRKDAWDFIWSSDNPELFAIMEKSRMYIFRGVLPEEPVVSSGYLCEFRDLEIKAVLMDDILKDPEQPEKGAVVTFQTKSLRDTRLLLETTPIEEAFQFISDNVHPRLWTLLAEHALGVLDLNMADKAFVKCNDYQGIRFVKRLQLISDRDQQRAEVAAYFRRFDEAEAIFLKIGKKNLAMDLRMRLGDWFRVVQLIQQGAGDDVMLRKAYKCIGDYYSDRQKWPKAIQFYEQAGDFQNVVRCAYCIDDYTTLERVVEKLPDGSEHLHDVGKKFMSVGLCSEAVVAYLKAGKPQAAIDCCVVLNQWDQAVSLAEKRNLQHIEGLLSKYASHLLQKDQLFQAVELYRKANQRTQAAQLLNKLGRQVGETRANPVRAKQLYVLAAMEMELYRKNTLGNAASTARRSDSATMDATLQTLMNHDARTSADKDLRDPWHGAEGYHFFLMAQRQLYSGSVEAAMKTAVRLTEYEDVLPERDVYSIIALTSYYNRHYKQCSRAFIRLESLESATEAERAKYKKLAFQIFTRHRPEDPKKSSKSGFSCTRTPGCKGVVRESASQCSECRKSVPVCVATGVALPSASAHGVYTCPTCKHAAVRSALAKLKSCPLCHSGLKM